LALDVHGGPNWVENYCDSSIIVNATAHEYYRQPMFYALAHFSKFIPPDSVRIDIKQEGNPNLQVVVFDTPEERTVLIALNRKDKDIPFELFDPLKKGIIKTVVSAHSIQSYVWSKR
jgi:glucosylceramidase